jgi:alkylation response protein AidB-like acyl-CoA dehydrogenase
VGGGEVHPWEFVQVLEALGRGDAATAWTVMTGATTGLLAAYVPEATAREVFGAPEVVPAGVFAPLGRARRVPGGYRVSGRWPFTSGVDNATVRLGGAMVTEEAASEGRGATPELRSFLFSPEDTVVLDTWRTAGLRGTGSHDMVVEDEFVPEGRTTCVLTDRPWAEGPLYRFSLFGLLALGVGAVGLGIARAALDEVKRLAGDKRQGRRALAETERAQIRIAAAEGQLRAARAFVRTAIDVTWGAPQVTPEQKAELRLAATHAASVAASVVDAAYHLGGGAAIYDASPLQRCFRDVHTLTQHVMVAEPSLRPIGRLQLGLPTDHAQL